MKATQVVEVKSRPMLFSAKLPLPSSIHQPMSWEWSDRKRLFEPLGSVGHLDSRMKWGVKCPYGVVGDRLWVRETCVVCADSNICYKADGKPDPWWGVKWKPSIFMPREACRIELRIESIEVERLQSITVIEIVLDGFEDLGKGIGAFEGTRSTLRGLFAGLWNKINGPGSWEANPFVWVIGFSRLSRSVHD